VFREVAVAQKYYSSYVNSFLNMIVFTSLISFFAILPLDLSKMDIQSNCVLCGESLSKGEVIVVERGMKTILEVSSLRKYGKYEHLQNAHSIQVHAICRKNYTRTKSGNLVGLSDESNTSGSRSVDNPRLIRSRLQNFEFKLHCVFCGNQADPKAEIKSQSSRHVSIVTTMKIKETVTTHAEKRNDDWGQVVLAGINSVIDLVAAEARYHTTCYARFIDHERQHDKPSKVGRPRDAVKERAFNYSFSLFYYVALSQTVPFFGN
jgi:predicted nucleic acid-binding Zn ribbon protein